MPTSEFDLERVLLLPADSFPVPETKISGKVKLVLGTNKSVNLKYLCRMYTNKLSTQAVDTFLTIFQTFKGTTTFYYCMYLEMEVGAFSMESESDCSRPEDLKILAAE
jgi:hypothetical protein